MYELFLTRRALRYYEKVDVPTTRRLNRCFDALREDPFAGGDIRPLKGEPGLYRYRVGDLRVIYQVDRQARTVTVVTILPRGEVYKKV